MRTILACLAFSAFAACSSSSTPPPDGTGNWDVTMTFDGGGNCNTDGLPQTFGMNFDIALAGGAYTITAEAGLQGDTTSGVMTCDSSSCNLQFSDTGPGSEFSNICTQTINANLVEDASLQVTGSGSIDFTLVDQSTCTATWQGAGDVAK